MFNYCTPKVLPDLKSQTFGDGKRYYVSPEGERLPSVTTVIGASKKKQIQEWRDRVGHETANKISAVASGRGTRFHSLCEQYLNNEPLNPTMPDALEMFQSVKPLLHNIDNIHYQEAALWSLRLKLAGRVDCIGEWEGKLSVIDFKTSRKIKSEDDIPDYFAQCTAYACMYEELIGNPIGQIVVLMAVENEQPIVFVKKTKDYIESLAKYIRYYRHIDQNFRLTGT